jgi:PX domain
MATLSSPARTGGDVVSDGGISDAPSTARSSAADASTPPLAPPIQSPPYWQVSVPQQRHGRSASLASVASTINSNRPAPIRLEDHTEEGEAAVNGSNGIANGHASAAHKNRATSLMSPPVKSPLWARVVRISAHTVVAGAVRGVGDYVVWTCNVDTLDGGTIVLRKRYSEFVVLRSLLEATFPKSRASLPVLPPKSVLKRFKESFLEKRRAGLEFFMK